MATKAKNPRTSLVTIDETQAAMDELFYGDKPAHPLLAFYAAALSNQVELSLNGWYVREIVRLGYLENGLPANMDTFKDALGRVKGKETPQGLMNLHFKSLYSIERAYLAGLLNFDSGETLESQRAWRIHMVQKILDTGLYGIGWKLASWAHYIFDPIRTQLCTIDTHHCNRLGVKQSSISGSENDALRNYLVLEDRVRAESLALYPDRHICVTQAMLWENERITKQLVEQGGYTSHRPISSRDY